MAVIVAFAAALGAVLGWGPSPWLGAAFAVVALAVRSPVALAAATLVLAGGLAARTEAGLVPVASSAFSGAVTLVGDPEPAGNTGLRVDVRLADGRHVEASASSPRAAAALQDRAAGEKVDVRGRLRRAPPDSDWLRNRHIAGRLFIDEVAGWSPGGWPARAANAVRSTLQRGASVLPERQRPLFLGFVLGDTRGQPADVTDDFRGSGLTHLLAVSGENVAFVLALSGPVLRRLSLRPRFAATLAVIGFFALVTRFEPSVLRASVMAALAVTATTIGREASRLRVLALAVAVLILIDPFLVWSVGFQLSVAASAGIVLLAPPLSRAIPGPRAPADALAVTVAAQAGVAPILILVFGGVPLASVPANLLAAPAAGLVMMWGVGAGLLAGLLGDGVARLLHWPTSLLIAWIATVAHRAAALPLGELGTRHLLLMVAGVLVIIAGRRWRHRVGSARVAPVAGATLIVVAVLAPSIALRARPEGPMELAPGAMFWRLDGASLLELDGRAEVASVLEALRRADARDLDVVVMRTRPASAATTIDTLRRWATVGIVLVPTGLSIAGATEVVDATDLELGGLDVRITPDDGRLLVDVARGPPV
jgi:competence protein ComEC